MPQPGDIPDPDPHRDPGEGNAPAAHAQHPGSPAGPDGGRGAGRWRRALGLAAVVVAVAAVGTLPVAWGALSGSEEEPEPRPGALHGPAGTGPVADFDHDGTQDVYATDESGGAVSVVYGSKEGGAGGTGGEGRRQRLNLDSAGVPGKEGKGVTFGDVATARDLDADGYTDLVASVAVRSGSAKGTHGGLVVVWGSAKGLSGGTYLKDAPKDYQRDYAHEPLVAGDFTGDKHTDLVVRIGDGHGLIKGPFTRDGSSAGTASVPSPFHGTGSDELVTALAGDVNGDGTDDLISSYATEQDGMGGGKVETSYVPGGDGKFGTPDTERLPGIDTATIGDVDKDGCADVVLRRFPKGSAPGTAVSGPVEVVHGSKDGPDPSRHTELDKDSPGVPGEKEENDQFGEALDAGDANGDGYADVAVGEHVEKGDKAGRSTVTVLRGSAKGLTGHGAAAAEEPDKIADEAREDLGNLFGSAVRLGDTNGDGKGDLAVGAPRTGGYAGAVWIFQGEKEGWPVAKARSYGPRDFGDPEDPDEEQIGAEVG